MINNKNILVIGLGKSGYYVSKLLIKNNKVTVTDKNDCDQKTKEEFDLLGINFIKSDHQEELLENGYDFIVRNPGVDPHVETIVKAKEKGIPFTNEVEIAYHYLPKNTKIIGITGSNGKTTTTTMIYDVLNMAFDNVYLGGNIGYPLSQIVESVKANSILVLEISDHQLYDMNDFKTDISVLVNLCPTHLDFHDNYENYINVKKKIFNHHTKDDLAIINFYNDDSLKITKDINSTKKYFNGNHAYINRDAIYINNKFVLALNDILVKGTHNYENIMAMLLVVDYFNVDINIVKEYLKKFTGVEHRQEFVKEINGVSYYNDSKSTNPTSTITALKAFSGNVHLILGGYERKQDFNELNGYLDKIKIVYALGQTTDRVYDWSIKNNIKCIKCYDLKTVMEKVKENVSKEDIVLLSPASASWDQYKKFEDRGNEFKNYVEE